MRAIASQRLVGRAALLSSLSSWGFRDTRARPNDADRRRKPIYDNDLHQEIKLFFYEITMLSAAVRIRAFVLRAM